MSIPSLRTFLAKCGKVRVAPNALNSDRAKFQAAKVFFNAVGFRFYRNLGRENTQMRYADTANTGISACARQNSIHGSPTYACSNSLNRDQGDMDGTKGFPTRGAFPEF